jgi:hypothetical protein
MRIAKADIYINQYSLPQLKGIPLDQSLHSSPSQVKSRKSYNLQLGLPLNWCWIEVATASRLHLLALTYNMVVPVAFEAHR